MFFSFSFSPLRVFGSSTHSSTAKQDWETRSGTDTGLFVSYSVCVCVCVCGVSCVCVCVPMCVRALALLLMHESATVPMKTAQSIPKLETLASFTDKSNS